MKRLLATTGACLAALLLCGPVARAGVVITGTRVILHAQQGEASVRLSNNGTRPALVETWIDRGNPRSSPSQVDVPFTITPPIFRMEAGKGQTLRIIYAGDSKLPVDRESVFWLNVLEIPPKPRPGDGDANRVQFAVRSRLKLFLRPAGLAGNPIKAPAQLAWHVAAAKDGGVAVRVDNPTPYHVTLSRVEVGTRTASTGMVAPFGSRMLTLQGSGAAPAAGSAVHFTAINDFGAPSAFEGHLQQ